jgi:hypothetical protein
MRILICLLFSIVAVDFATAAGCEISLRVKNQTEYAIKVNTTDTYREERQPGDLAGKRFRGHGLDVKTRATPWRGVAKGGWDWEPTGTKAWWYYWHTDERSKDKPGIEEFLLPGATKFDTYKAGLGCGVKRRYKLQVDCYEVGLGRPNKPTLLNRERIADTKTIYFPGAKQWTERQNVTIPVKSCK